MRRCYDRKPFIAAERKRGRVSFLEQPFRLAFGKPPPLAQGRQDKRAIITPQAGIPCAAGLNLRIPARVAARRILRAFGTAERRAFYACRSFFAKIFSRENILAISYNVVAKGFTCYAFCAPICCSRSLWRKSECGDAMIVSSLSPQRENETEQRLRVPRRCCLFLTEFCRAFARENS